MAKSSGGLFSLDRKGTIGDAITFTSYKGKPYVRAQSKRKQPRSGMQVGMRALTKWISQDFKTLDPNEVEVWREQGRSDDITPLNAWLRDSQNRQQEGLGWRRQITLDPKAVAPPIELVVIPEFRSLVFSWRRPGLLTRGTYTTAIYLKSTDDVEGVISDLRVLIPVTNDSVQITGLTSGQTVFLKVRETLLDGQLGFISASISTVIE